jgi:hypothetical protein
LANAFENTIIIELRYFIVVVMTKANSDYKKRKKPVRAKEVKEKEFGNQAKDSQSVQYRDVIGNNNFKCSNGEADETRGVDKEVHSQISPLNRNKSDPSDDYSAKSSNGRIMKRKIVDDELGEDVIDVKHTDQGMNSKSKQHRSSIIPPENGKSALDKQVASETSDYEGIKSSSLNLVPCQQKRIVSNVSRSTTKEPLWIEYLRHRVRESVVSVLNEFD